jgi:hypothetical protein
MHLQLKERNTNPRGNDARKRKSCMHATEQCAIFAEALFWKRRSPARLRSVLRDFSAAQRSCSPRVPCRRCAPLRLPLGLWRRHIRLLGALASQNPGSADRVGDCIGGSFLALRSLRHADL